ncbi:hypothetical protein SUGI_0799000 [Cryptomeria japonica]|nr:hypothetical protein SUGI_0799000 [Cryptomeria japonica]
MKVVVYFVGFVVHVLHFAASVFFGRRYRQKLQRHMSCTTLHGGVALGSLNNTRCKSGFAWWVFRLALKSAKPKTSFLGFVERKLFRIDCKVGHYMTSSEANQIRRHWSWIFNCIILWGRRPPHSFTLCFQKDLLLPLGLLLFITVFPQTVFLLNPE